MTDQQLDFELRQPTPVRLSQTKIWDALGAYYDMLGEQAWTSGIVPSYSTSNCYIANAYAEMILAIWLDKQAQNNTDPLTIIELGSGHGKFGFYLLRQLESIFASRGLDLNGISLVMTDYSEQNIQFLREQPQLAPYVEKGLVDFAIVNGGTDRSIRLITQGITYSSQNQIANNVVIANYFFDSLPIDVFRVTDGMLQQALVTISLTGDPPHILKPSGFFERLNLSWSHQPVASTLYQDSQLNEILLFYQHQPHNITFNLPFSSISTLQFLASMTAKNLFVLSADKGFNHIEEMIGRGSSMACHGSFSFMVNFHAIGKWFENRGGVARHSSQRTGSVRFSAFSLTNPLYDSTEFQFAFQKRMEEFNPMDFFALRKSTKDTGALSREKIYAIIRLSCYDPHTFIKYADDIKASLSKPSSLIVFETEQMLERVFANHYQLGQNELLFKIGLIYRAIRNYSVALKFFEQYLSSNDNDAFAHFYVGFCLYKLDQPEKAQLAFERAYKLKPDEKRFLHWHKESLKP